MFYNQINRRKCVEYYLKFRTIKLNLIEKYILQLIDCLLSLHLLFLYNVKLCFGEDIRYVDVDNQCQIYVIHVDSENDTIRTLWKWKYTGLNIADFKNDDHAHMYIKHNQRNYILYINVEGQEYYFYDVQAAKESLKQTIEFDQIVFDLDF
jgi:hypothetical protein